ncbi:hypothetical protein K9N68_37165 (plasmid) [Kovacikia minuta CCNUW1]|uniref:ParB/RepB/Spo0J family partition protein n=1 Tax=Kovacikia minuta TaxID=2931930 RepID=UPI001CCCE3C4|nr:hypothetical protein [Kovacikia minuta]UBF29843.1 hypothetical protein K9N68_37165 [Kovacikia minuta CCNUW1]
MSRVSRAIGSVAVEVISFDPELISIRLEDGTYIGPKIGKFDDGKLHLLPGEVPLEYTPEILSLIESKGWNVRQTYDVDALKDLEQGILSFGGTGGWNPNQPLQLVFSGDRLFLVDGHRRHLVNWILGQKGIVFRPMYGTVVSLGQAQGGRPVSIRDLEYRLMTQDELHQPHSALERARKIQRMMEADLKIGISAEEFKEAFIKNTGWTAKKYEATLALMSYPPDILQAVSEKKLPETKALNLLVDPKLTMDDAVDVLRQSIQGSETVGKSRVTGQFIDEVAKKKKEEKKPLALPPAQSETGLSEGFSLPLPGNLKLESGQTGSGQTESSQAQAENGSRPALTVVPKPIVPKATAKEKAAVLDRLVKEATARSMGVTTHLKIDSQLWEECLEIHYRGVK